MTTAAQGARLRPLQSVAMAVPAWGWVGIIYILSVAFRFALSSRIDAPWIFQDELVYAELARNLSEHGHFAIRDSPGLNGFGPLYPVLIAPAWAIFGTPSTAYTAAKLINALLLSLAVIPTFVIARKLMRPSYAAVAALFSVAIPSLAYANTLLSENAFYPAVMAAAAALFLLLERPTLLRVAGFFLFTVFAFLVRAQGVILLAALVAGIAVVVVANVWHTHAGRVRALRRELLRFWMPLAAVLLAIALVWVYEAARGRPLKSVLGATAGVTGFQHPLLPTLRWTLHHFGELDLYLGVIPFVAMIVLATLGLRGEGAAPELRAFAAASVALVAVFVLTASLYAVDIQGQRIEERYMFHVAPLFFIALLAWIERGLPRPLALTGLAAAAGAGFAALVPYDQLITSDVVHDAFALVPLLSLELRGTISSHSVGALVGVCAIIAASLAVGVAPRRAWVLVALLLVYYAVIEVRPIQRRIEQASRDAIGAGISGRKDWVDREVGSNADVALLTYGGLTALPFVENEFFNRSVRKVYTMSGPWDSLPRTEVAPTPAGTLQDAGGNDVRSRFVLANYLVIPNGRLLESDGPVGMALYETDGPLRLHATMDGIYVDRWSGPTAIYRQYGCRGGTLRAHVLSDPDLYHRGVQTLTATLGSKTLAQETVRSTRAATMSVPLPRNVATCVVNFNVSPTAVPAQVRPGDGDTRTLGIRFLRFDYRPGR